MLFRSKLPMGDLSLFRVGAQQNCQAHSSDFKMFIAPTNPKQISAIPERLQALQLDESIEVFKVISAWISDYNEVKRNRLALIRREVEQAVANVQAELSRSERGDGKSHITLLMDLINAVEASIRVTFVAVPSYDARVQDAVMSYAEKSMRSAI